MALWVTPEHFGTTGTADDHAVLQLWANALGNGVDGWLTRATYITSQYIGINGKSYFTVQGESTIKIKDGTATAYGSQAFLLGDCHHFIFRDFTCDGNRANRTPAEVDAHTITFYSCHHYLVENVKSINAVCDGFNLESATPGTKSTHNHDFTFRDCYAFNCYRQGMSIIEGHNGLIDNCEFSGTNGVSPSAGLDLESDAGATTNAIENILIRGTRFIENDGFGLQVSGSRDPRNIHTIDCHYEDNVAGAISWEASSGSIIRPFCSGFTNSGTRGVIDIGSTTTAGNLLIDRPIFRGITTNAGDKPLIYVHGNSAGHVTVKDIDVDSCRTVAIFSAPHCRATGGSVRGATASDAFSLVGADCSVKNLKMTAFTLIAIRLIGARCEARENDLYDPSTNNSAGMIYGDTGAGHVICNNRCRYAASTAGYGIATNVAPVMLRDNIVENVTGNPYAITGTPLSEGGNIANSALLYTGSGTWNPASLADGAGETSAGITVTGAALGDFVLVAAPYDLQGITCNGYVSAAGTVKIRLQNETGATIDLASGTWKARVQKAA